MFAVCLQDVEMSIFNKMSQDLQDVETFAGCLQDVASFARC